MSEELLQLLFFAFIFIALPAIDGVLRGKKKKRRGPISRGPVEDVEVEWEPTPTGEPEDRWDSAEEPRRPGPDRKPPGATERSSEGLLPADLWEELAALARGERRPERIPSSEDEATPASDRAAPGRGDTEEIDPWAGAVPAPETRDSHALEPHQASRRSRAPRPIPPKPAGRAARKSWRDEDSPIETGAIGSAADEGARGTAATDVLGTLQRMSLDDLQRAVIFREVLGPPISERPGPLAESREP